MIVHACVMAFAWLFCAPMAILAVWLRRFSRFKPWLTRTRIKGGRQYWYILHRGGLVTAVLMTMIGGTTMITNTERHLSYTHSKFGLTVMSSCLFQALNGLYRLGKGHKLRKQWEYLHKCFGFTLFGVGEAARSPTPSP